MAELRELSAVDERNYRGRLDLADMLLALGDSGAAATVLDEVIYIHPMDMGLHSRLAELSAAVKRWPEAIRERRAVLALDPVDRAEALYQLARVYFDEARDNPAFLRGVERIAESGPSRTNLYYNYYAQRLMFQAGGDTWREWNHQMINYLAETQATEGHESGSWYCEGGGHGAQRGGRLYATAIAAMTLEVYYRHLPIYDKPGKGGHLPGKQRRFSQFAPRSKQP